MIVDASQEMQREGDDVAADEMDGVDSADRVLDYLNMSAKERVAAKAVRAPFPKGFTKMTFDGPGNGKAVFEILAGKGNDFLDLEGSRSWLRSVGWVVSDSELDKILMTDSYTTWNLKDLEERNDKNKDRPNGDPDEILWGLKKLAHGRSSISKDDLQDLIVAEGSLSVDEFIEMMKIVGLEKERVVNCEALIHALLGAICKPPSASELAAMGWIQPQREEPLAPQREVTTKTPLGASKPVITASGSSSRANAGGATAIPASSRTNAAIVNAARR